MTKGSLPSAAKSSRNDSGLLCVTGDALHLGLQLLRSDRPLPVIFECLRVAEIIFYLLFNLLGRHHLIEGGLRLRILFRPNAMPPINFLNRALVSYAIG